MYDLFNLTMKFIYVLFTHSSDGHREYFHMLAIVNYAAINMGIHVSYSILLSQFIVEESEVYWVWGKIPGF